MFPHSTNEKNVCMNAEIIKSVSIRKYRFTVIKLSHLTPNFHMVPVYYFGFKRNVSATILHTGTLSNKHIYSHTCIYAYIYAYIHTFMCTHRIGATVIENTGLLGTSFLKMNSFR
jgi:hypothetical protein